MLWLWTFIQDPDNRELISWLGGGVVAVAAGGWAVVKYAFPHYKPVARTTTVTETGSIGVVIGGNANAPISVGLDEQKAAEKFAEAQRPLTDQLERLAAQVERGVEIAPLRTILVKLGEAGIRDDDIGTRLDEKADELIKLREEIARLRLGSAELARFAQQAQALIDKGDFEGAHAALVAGRAAARKLREQSSRYEADFLVQEARVDHLQLAYGAAAERYAEAASLIAAFDSHKQWELTLAQAGELLSQGEDFGDNIALQTAIAV